MTRRSMTSGRSSATSRLLTSLSAAFSRSERLHRLLAVRYASRGSGGSSPSSFRTRASQCVPASRWRGSAATHRRPAERTSVPACASGGASPPATESFWLSPCENGGSRQFLPAFPVTRRLFARGEVFAVEIGEPEADLLACLVVQRRNRLQVLAQQRHGEIGDGGEVGHGAIGLLPIRGGERLPQRRQVGGEACRAADAGAIRQRPDDGGRITAGRDERPAIGK